MYGTSWANLIMLMASIPKIDTEDKPTKPDTAKNDIETQLEKAGF